MRCFLTCAEFDDCDSSRCQNQCADAADDQFSRIAFTVEECQHEDDLCVFREFIFADRNDAARDTSVQIPGGCLLNYQHVENNIKRFHFARGTNLFTCDSELCNLPPLEDCDEVAATARREGNDTEELCVVLQGRDRLNQVLNDNRDIRGGEFDFDLRGRCLNRQLREFDSNATCFGTAGVGQGESTESQCTNLQNLTEIPTVTCAECEQDPACDVNVVTPAPGTSIETSAPVGSAGFLEDNLVLVVVAAAAMFVVLLVAVALIGRKVRNIEKGTFVVKKEDVEIIDSSMVQGLSSAHSEPQITTVDHNEPQARIVTNTPALNDVVVVKEDELSNGDSDLSVARLVDSL